MAEQRIDIQPVPVSLPLPTDPMPGLQAERAEKTAASFNNIANQSIEVLDRIQTEKASSDAAQLVNDIGKGVVQPPSSFLPAGLQSRSYAENFKKTAEALYFQQSTEAFNNYANEQRAKYPLDPARVETELAAKKAEMLGVVGNAEYKPYLELRYNAISSQHVSSVLNAKTQDNQQQKAVQAQRTLDAWTSQVSTSGQWGDKLDTATADATAKYHQSYFDNEVAPLLRDAGKSPEDIKNLRQAAVDKAQIQRIQQKFADTGGLQISVEGHVSLDPGAVADWNQRINHMFEGEPNMVQKRAAARVGIQEAASIVNGRSQRTEMIATGEVQKGLREASTQAARDKLEAIRTGGVDPAQAWAQKLDAAQQALATMQRTDLSTANKMQLMAGLDHIHGGVNANNQEYFQSQILRLSAAASDPTPRPGAEALRADARQQLEAITDNPTVMNAMTPALQAHALSSVAAAHHRQAMTSWQSGRQAMAEGRLTDEAVGDMERTMTADGRLAKDGSGVTTPEEFHQLRLNNAAVRTLKQQQMQVAQNALDNINMNKPLSAQDHAAIEQKVPWSGPGGWAQGAAADINTPQGMASLTSYISTFKHMPDAARKQLNEAGFLSGDPAIAQQYKTVYQAMVDAYTTGTDEPSQLAAQKLADEALGGKIGPMGRTVQLTSPETAAKTYMSNNPSSASRQYGESEKAVLDKSDAVMTNTLNDVAANLSHSGVVASILPQTADEKMIRQMALPGARTSGLAWGGLEQGISGVRVENAKVRDLLQNHYSSELAKHGNLDSTLGMDKQKSAMTSAIIHYRDMLEFAPDEANPGGAVLRMKGTQSIMASLVGMEPGQLPMATGRAILAGTTQSALDRGIVSLPPGLSRSSIDYSNIEINAYLTATGAKRYQVSAPVNHTWLQMVVGNRGNVTPLYDMPADDPLFHGVGKALTQRAASIGQAVFAYDSQKIDELTKMSPPLAHMLGYSMKGGQIIANGLFGDMSYAARVRLAAQEGTDRPELSMAPWSWTTDILRRAQTGDLSTVLHSDARSGPIVDAVNAEAERRKTMGPNETALRKQHDDEAARRAWLANPHLVPQH